MFARLIISLPVIFLCILFIILTGPQAFAWPPNNSDIETIALKETSGIVRGAQIRTEIELAWQHADLEKPPTLLLRLSAAVANLPPEYSVGRVSFVAGIFRLGLPKDVSVNTRHSGFLCWNGSAWDSLNNRVLSETEENAIAAIVGRDVLYDFQSSSFDTHQVTNAYARYVTPDAFIINPSTGFFSSSAGDEISEVDFHWLEPADEWGNPLINRADQPASLVDVMPIELSIPFDSIEGGECNFYLGYLEAVCLERVSPSSRNPNEIIYNYRVWEGRIRITSSQSTDDSETLVADEQSSGSQVAEAVPEENLSYVIPGSTDGMVWIPHDTYRIGIMDDDQSNIRGDRPLRNRQMGGFYIDIYPVTNTEYRQFIAATGYDARGDWRRYEDPGAEKYPVRGISYFDALAFAEWAGKRLPTEEEWEVAARGTDNRKYPWGNSWVNSYAATNDYADVDAHPDNVSPFGVREMIGNVWEWTSSFYFPQMTGEIFPNSLIVLKGGSVNCSSEMCRIASRGADPSNSANASYGFRCVMDASEESAIHTLIGPANEAAVETPEDESAEVAPAYEPIM